MGGGKSSLVNNLRNVLSANIDVCTLRLTAYPNLSYALFSLLALLLYNYKVLKLYSRVGVHPSTLAIKRIRKVNALTAMLITLLEIASIHLWRLYKSFKCRRSRIVLIDEGFINAVANYVEVLGKHSSVLIHYVYKLLRRFSQNHKLVFIFLTADINTLRRRWLRRRYPIETSFIDLFHHIRYVKLMMFSMRVFSKLGFKVHVIDATYKDLNEVVQEALKLINLVIQEVA